MKREHELNPTLAREIVARRRAVGLSQNALALAAGLTEAAIAKYETLRCPIAPHRLDAIERALSDAERTREVA